MKFLSNRHRLLSLRLSMFVFFVSLIVSCQSTVKEITLSVQPDITSLHFTSDGLTAFSGGAQISPSFVVNTNAESWNVEVSPEDALWCHAEKIQGERGFVISADLNESKEQPVAAIVTITAGDAAPVSITVTQDGAYENILVVTPDTREINFPVTGGRETYTIETDASYWDVKSNAEWCNIEIDEENYSFTIVVGESSTEAKEPAVVVLTAGNADPISISVSQEPYNILDISPDMTSLVLPAEGGSETFTVTTNAGSWTATVEAGWCEVETTANTLTISAPANETGYEMPSSVVLITAGNASREISVSQKAKEKLVYRLGDYYPDPDAVYENGILVSGTAAEGIVVWLDPESDMYDASGDVPQGTSGKIMSITGIELTWGQVGPTNADSNEDGAYNMAAIQSYISSQGLVESDFPAFYRVVSEMNGKQKWSSGDVWYLPSLFEVKQLCAGMFGMVYEDLTDWVNGDRYATLPGCEEEAAKKAKAEFVAKLVAAGGSDMTKFIWTSTENPDNDSQAHAVNPNYGQYSLFNKSYNSLYTYAVRKF